ncbi:MAG: D-sedoheptulose-7-phosphate isomerase [Candidatus Dormibacteria bacterium]
MTEPLSLYPMLRDQGPAAAAVVLELARAPLEKAADSNRLRRALIDERAVDIASCAREVSAAILAGGRVLACGNGGSATSAADLVAELLHPGPGAPPAAALCLTADVAVVTAIGNDVSFDDIFTRQLEALGRADDVLVAISTSGNSENLVRAARLARTMRMTTIGIAGHDGGRMRSEGAFDHLFVVPSSSVHRIQEVQTTLYHLLTLLVQRHLQEAA